MSETPRTTIRFPQWIKDAVKKRASNFSKFVIDAVIEKLNREEKLEANQK